MQFGLKGFLQPVQPVDFCLTFMTYFLLLSLMLLTPRLSMTSCCLTIHNGFRNQGESLGSVYSLIKVFSSLEIGSSERDQTIDFAATRQLLQLQPRAAHYDK